MKTFKCKVCGYIHTGDKAPEVCPQCGQTGVFEEVKKGINIEGNGYTLIYATIIVVVAALLLAVVSSALKPRQEANIALDTQKQILYSVFSQEQVAAEEDPAFIYKELIKETTTPDGKPLFIATVPTLVKEHEEDTIAQGVWTTKYIIPMTGNGLWGGIWGYLALDDDKNTIFGAFFNHSGETPGLGAEIITAKFQDQFKGKHILRDGKVAGLGIEKVGQVADGMEQVDAISGATITCQGVEDMINNTLAEYAAFLESPCADSETTKVVEVVEVAEEPADSVQ